MSDLPTLLDRVRAASGGDRELDGLIWKTLTEQTEDVWHDHDGVWMLQDPQDTIAYSPPPYLSASIEAAVALVEAKGFSWSLDATTPNTSVECWLLGSNDTEGYQESGPTPALALLTTLLSALAQGASG